MEALKFDLYGRYAHFKNPENNKKIEISYDNIPKTVLLGQLGAILGLKGKQQERELGYIEYVEELKNTRVSIIPHKAKFKKHIDELVNSTGFANSGENQILRRQILEDVRWSIFILKDSVKENHFAELYKMLMVRKTRFPLYLGKNEFRARISEVELVNLDIIDIDNIEKCDSLIKNNCIDEIIKQNCGNHFIEESELFLRNDYLPVDYNKAGLYNLEKFTFTNCDIEVSTGKFYTYDNLVLNFF